MQFFLWSFSVLVEKIITSVDDGGGSRRGEGMYAVPQRSHCGPEPWILIKNLREEEEKIHPLVQLIIFYDKLAEKHLWKVDFLQIFQRLKEVFESNFLPVDFFWTENSRGFASTEGLNFLPSYQFCKYVLSALYSPTLFRSQSKSQKRWEIQTPCAKSQKSLFLKKPGQYLAQSARYCAAAATTTPEAAQGLF